MIDVSFLDRLRARLDAEIGRFAGPHDRYALINFPYYANVGDSAIWLGATATLRRMTGRAPALVAGIEWNAFSMLKRRLGDATIYISGGGNFGDLYPDHQRFRECVIARFPENRIVQLPQSIHFRSAEALRRAAEAIRRHSDFHLLVRDRSSEAFARAHFECPVRLAPDCAFGLRPLRPSAQAVHDLVGLLRHDEERAASGHEAFHALASWRGDWIRESVRPIARLKLAALLARLATPGFSERTLAARFDRMAERRLSRGIGLLSSGQQVMTDRLHGHILCVLLGIPHVALDNSYGKVGACYRDWTHEVETGRYASGSVPAVAALAELPKRPMSGARSPSAIRSRRPVLLRGS